MRNVAFTRALDVGCDCAEVFEAYRWIIQRGPGSPRLKRETLCH